MHQHLFATFRSVPSKAACDGCGCVQAPVPSSGGKFRQWCYKLATNDYFDYFVLFLVLVNVLEMCVWWYGIDEGTLAMKENLNLLLSALFGVCSIPSGGCFSSLLAQPLNL